MKFAAGNYLNLFEDGGLDIFIIFNEPNETPTRPELVAFQYIIKDKIRELRGNYIIMDNKELQRTLENEIKETNFKCVECGIQVFIVHGSL